MATIRPNEHAPQEDFKVILPTATFDLSSGGSHETDDRVVLSDAEAHPWLTVEYPEAVELSVQPRDPHVPYEADYLSAPNSKAFDADAVREVEASKASGAETRTAVEAGLDQNREERVGDVAVTLAADSADSEDEITDDKPARKSGGRSK